MEKGRDSKVVAEGAKVEDIVLLLVAVAEAKPDDVEFGVVVLVDSERKY